MQLMSDESRPGRLSISAQRMLTNDDDDDDPNFTITSSGTRRATEHQKS
jgi:hypothetical protein